MVDSFMENTARGGRAGMQTNKFIPAIMGKKRLGFPRAAFLTTPSIHPWQVTTGLTLAPEQSRAIPAAAPTGTRTGR
jgi:hypothetical protein